MRYILGTTPSVNCCFPFNFHFFSARHLTHGTSPKFLLSSTSNLGEPSIVDLSWHGTFTFFCTYCNHYLWLTRVAVTRHNKWVPCLDFLVWGLSFICNCMFLVSIVHATWCECPCLLFCPFQGRAYDCSTGRNLTSRSAWRGTWERWRSSRCTGSTTMRSTPLTWARSAFSSARTDYTQTGWLYPRWGTRIKGASLSFSLEWVCMWWCQALTAAEIYRRYHEAQIAICETTRSANKYWWFFCSFAWLFNMGTKTKAHCIQTSLNRFSQRWRPRRDVVVPLWRGKEWPWIQVTSCPISCLFLHLVWPFLPLVRGPYLISLFAPHQCLFALPTSFVCYCNIYPSLASLAFHVLTSWCKNS